MAGFALTALPNHYAGQGLDVAAIGRHVALVGTPWVLQPLWGPLVDRARPFRMGRRRGWLLLALGASVLALLALGALGGEPAARPGTVALLLALHAAAAALLDTATDALVIDRAPPHRLGRINALTRAGFVGGIAAGAVLSAWMLPAHGLAAVAGALAGAGLLAALAPLALRERPGDAFLSLARVPRAAPVPGAPGASGPRAARRLLAVLARPRSLALLGLCVALDAAVAALQLPLAAALVREGGWSPAALSRWQAGVTLAAGTAGALAVGLWADRVGAARALPRLLGAAALGLAGLALATGGKPGPLAGPLALGLAGAVPTLLFVVLAPVVMRASRCAMAATRFAVFMAALNLGDVVGAALAGPLDAALPAGGAALMAALVFAAGAAVAARPGALARPGDPARPRP